MTTMQFKCEWIDNAIEQFKPTIIHMWDDRPGHTGKFRSFLSSKYPKIKSRVFDVHPAGETYVPFLFPCFFSHVGFCAPTLDLHSEGSRVARRVLQLAPSLHPFFSHSNLLFIGGYHVHLNWHLLNILMGSSLKKLNIKPVYPILV